MTTSISSFLHFSILARNLAPRPWPLVGSSSWELLPLQPPASTAIKREKNKLRKKITLKTTPGLCARFKRVQNIRKNAHTHTHELNMELQQEWKSVSMSPCLNNGKPLLSDKNGECCLWRLFGCIVEELQRHHL